MDKAKIWTKDFILITTINLTIFLGFQGLTPTLPIYMKNLDFSDDIIGWMVGLFTVSSLIMRAVSGLWMDKAGRRAVFLIGLISFAATTLLYPVTSVLWLLLTIRLINGFAWGGLSTASSTIATDLIAKERFGEGMGYFSLSVALALAIAPQIALKLQDIGGFALVAEATAGMMLIVLIIFFFLKLPHIEKNVSGSKWPYERSAIVPAILMAFVTFSYGAVASFVSIYGASQGVENIGYFFTVYAVVLLVSRPIFGKMVDKYSIALVCVPGFLLLALGLASLCWAHSLASFLVSAVLFSLGFSAGQSSLQTMAVRHAPPTRIGAANGTFFTGFDAGIGIGAVVSGAIANQVGYAYMYLIMAVAPIIGGIIMYIYTRKVPD